ncbi:hypothetical protein ORJ04_03585 [Rheinheimera baltica]|uniref:Uncharacterized protein n=1 Tax=Rheinheimera baltica TaxID=67576 RepID=A0ABT9HV74_9GAMM|nr:hypothetical protein [Rheinheimera baltica]MDP5135029.1 hypothetical protein [Rheinheimera baltica]
MSEKKYLCSPNNDMSILFDNVFGTNYTRAVISGETPKEDKWVKPFFTSRIDALIFQDLLIGQLSIDETPADKLETQLMTGDMYYGISMAVLQKLRAETDLFLQGSAQSMTVDGENSVLALCGLGSAGVPLMYNRFNQSITPEQIAQYLDQLSISSRDTLKVYINSNASAAQRNYTFASMSEMQQQFAANLRGNNGILAGLIGTQGSLAAEVYSAINNKQLALKHDYSSTEVYGYLFPYLTQGAEAYGVDESGLGLSKWKTLSMAALATVYTTNKDYYQQVPIRRSLTKIKMVSAT